MGKQVVEFGLGAIGDNDLIGAKGHDLTKLVNSFDGIDIGAIVGWRESVRFFGWKDFWIHSVRIKSLPPAPPKEGRLKETLKLVLIAGCGVPAVKVGGLA